MVGEVPDWVWERKDAEMLILADNGLSVAGLPKSVGALTELRQVDLRGNPLAALPEELVRLPKLEKIDLRWVDVTGFADVLDALEARGCVVYT
jgi:hypothetical protein